MTSTENPTPEAAPENLLSSKEAAKKFAIEWIETKSGEVYLGNGDRMVISHQTSSMALELLCSYDGNDWDKSDKEFSDDFMAMLGPQLSPHNLSILITALGRELIDWGRKVGTDNSMGLVFETIEQLEGMATIAAPEESLASPPPSPQDSPVDE